MLVIVLLIAYYAASDRLTPMTTDAYVQAYVVQVAPQVAGQVVRVYAREGDAVSKGALLFELDPRPFEHKVALLRAKHVEAEQQVKQLQAQVAAAKAEHERLTAEATYARQVFEQEERIFKKESTTERKYQDATQKHQASIAAVQRSAQLVKQAEEALDARIEGEHALSNTEPRSAPVIRCAVNQHRQAERQAQPAGESSEPGAAEAVQSQVAREGQQHQVSKPEPGNADLQPLPSLPGRDLPAVARFQRPECQRGFIAQRGQKRRDDL